MGKDFNPFKRLIEADPKIEPKRPATGSAALDQEIIKLFQSHAKLEKNLANAKDKLESIKNALPNFNTMQFWGSGPQIFVNKIRAIIDAP